jgi:acyl carrier protein
VISADTLSAVVDTLVEVLGVDPESLDASTPLFGSMPEFDSLAIVEVIAILEDRFGFEMDEADISLDVFGTVGSLASYLEVQAGLEVQGA